MLPRKIEIYIHFFYPYVLTGCAESGNADSASEVRGTAKASQ